MATTIFFKLLSKCPICGSAIILQTRIRYDSPVLSVEPEWISKAGPAAEGARWWTVHEKGNEFDSDETLRCDTGHTSDEMLPRLGSQSALLFVATKQSGDDG